MAKRPCNVVKKAKDKNTFLCQSDWHIGSGNFSQDALHNDILYHTYILPNMYLKNSGTSVYRYTLVEK